mmetsp:Transcript_13080/g.17695  ORF Transcript_13080/g.17695 Transcript_13080/m.17695 type:complete len:125 (-) Transcript_13080:759-1133(-)|eukprot:CAMPEP_0185622794 /NCGR_PEP_ID=MMETSP0436-20130131/59443_1 /TAXON_ID=626734 ORGANISM="Favella taraikaensis, Strain Fe Narragansett Bay" /NCGR_SAMPLE_ID=MMETSP0436 /ASSEMBLY_ACC=CAM_ASM_000390 /LENGTH=124 /DNA_ID=CAMNT_0028264615 /DNA_START=913 /DNA_END=1287 /DNA_ORIENTATION=-
MQRREVNLDKSQIMHLYRMSLGTKKPMQHPQQAVINDPGADTVIRVNSMLAGSAADSMSHNQSKYENFGLMSASSHANQNQGPARAHIQGSVTKPPKSANSSAHPQFSHLHSNGAGFGGYSAAQ